MEAARTADSRKHLRGIFPNINLVPWPLMHEPCLSQGLRIFQEDRRCLAFLDGYRTFLEVMAVSEQSEVSVLQACAQLKEAGRLKVLAPDALVRATPIKAGLFRKADHLELSATYEARWQGMGPYGNVANVRVLLPEGAAVEPVRFVKGMDESILGIPKELMQSWGLPEGKDVTVRPAP
jgi:hypothetical protein